jgi:hypothetical protein
VADASAAKDTLAPVASTPVVEVVVARVALPSP